MIAVRKETELIGIWPKRNAPLEQVGSGQHRRQSGDDDSVNEPGLPASLKTPFHRQQVISPGKLEEKKEGQLQSQPGLRGDRGGKLHSDVQQLRAPGRRGKPGRGQKGGEGQCEDGQKQTIRQPTERPVGWERQKQQAGAKSNHGLRPKSDRSSEERGQGRQGENCIRLRPYVISFQDSHRRDGQG